MGFSGALLALSAVKGIASIGSGYAQSGEDNYNASLATQQAQLINLQGNIEQGQYARKGGELLSTQTADTAANGLEPTGSAAAVMLNAQTQIHTDAAIAAFNNQMGQNRANSEASLLKQKGRNAIASGYSSAFSDMLTGATQYGMYNSKSSWSLSSGGSFSNTAPFNLS